MNNNFKILEPNILGNDFFISDIHGAYHFLSKHLEEIHFNPKTDRLICVGDLLDRNNESHQLQDWINRPYFHSVKGNHEEMYLHWVYLKENNLDSSSFENSYFRNGGSWVLNHNLKFHKKLAEKIRELPLFMVVENIIGNKIGVVHASLPDGCSWPDFAKQELKQETIDCLLWSTDRIDSEIGYCNEHIYDEGIIPGLDAIICGHKKVENPTWAGKFFYIETQGWKEEGRFNSFSYDEIILKRPFRK